MDSERGATTSGGCEAETVRATPSWNTIVNRAICGFSTTTLKAIHVACATFYCMARIRSLSNDTVGSQSSELADSADAVVLEPGTSGDIVSTGSTTRQTASIIDMIKANWNRDDEVTLPTRTRPCLRTTLAVGKPLLEALSSLSSEATGKRYMRTISHPRKREDANVRAMARASASASYCGATPNLWYRSWQDRTSD